ncbi:spinster family MFS transporter [Acinetobacter sp. Ver3]|uniref:spinster family MFS transporter n=1 Tax=Acinetobacter sp. Ver3 TaxID=466088 RepID=UPI00044D34A9|nr:MFS transporter [Acinetobacter sp. Ver3]EZQ10649.1 MFS transporter [Acinetobacter sp. Ver3]
MQNTLNAEEPASVKKNTRYAWYVVTLCMLAYVFSYIDRQILVLMIEPIKADLNLTDTQFSLLHGLAFSLFYAFMGLPIAYLADRFSRPKIIAIGIIFWSLATAACGLSKNFIQLFLSRMGIGIGEAALSPAAYSMFSDMFSKDKLGKAVGIYSIGSFIGGGMAFLVGGYVISLLKDATFIDVPLLGMMKAWQVAFILVGLPGVFIGLLFILTVRDPQRTGQKLDASGNVVKVKFTDSFKFLKKHSKTFTCHYMGFTFYAMALFCVMSWSPAFYMRNSGLSPVETGYMLGTILLIANTSGVFFAGWLTDYLTSKGRRDAAMYAGYLGGLGIILPIISYTLVDSLWLSVAIFTVAMFFASFPMPTSTAAMQILAPNQLRAQISAIFLLISSLIGLGIGTTLVALITDKVFGDTNMVGYSISIVGGFSALLTIILLKTGCKHFVKSLDVEKDEMVR